MAKTEKGHGNGVNISAFYASFWMFHRFLMMCFFFFRLFIQLICCVLYPTLCSNATVAANVEQDKMTKSNLGVANLLEFNLILILHYIQTLIS